VLDQIINGRALDCEGSADLEGRGRRWEETDGDF